MKTKIFIILGLLFFLAYSCRNSGNDEPLTKEAYGLAVYSPLKNQLTIKDELDSIEPVKTYLTNYAAFGTGDEKIDWSRKVYVYAKGSTVELISHLDIERSEAYVMPAAKQGFKAFWHSSLPFILLGAGAALLLLYYICLRLADTGWKIVLIRGGATLVFVTLAVLSFFCDSWLKKSPEPVKITVQAAVQSNGAEMADAQRAEKAYYVINGETFALPLVLNSDERAYFRYVYDDVRGLTFRLFWVVVLALMSIAARYVVEALFLWRQRVFLDSVSSSPFLLKQLRLTMEEAQKHPERKAEIFCEMLQKCGAWRLMQIVEFAKQEYPGQWPHIEEAFKQKCGQSLEEVLNEANDVYQRPLSFAPNENGDGGVSDDVAAGGAKAAGQGGDGGVSDDAAAGDAKAAGQGGDDGVSDDVAAGGAKAAGQGGDDGRQDGK